MTRAGIGAGVTLVLSVVPVGGLVAPAIGGGVASWIARDTRSTGSRIGATAGGLVTLLLLPLVSIMIAIASSISPAAAVGAFGLTVLTAVYVIGSAAVAGDLAEDIALNRRSETEPTEEPLARLKRRYVDEKIDNVEFERRVETLIEAGRTCERNITPDSKDPSQ